MSLREEIIDIIVDQLAVEKQNVKDDVPFVEGLGADSLDLTELIMTLEERFNCEISQEAAEKLKTVGDVINFVEKHKAS